MIEWRTVPSFPDYEASSEAQIRRCTPLPIRNRCIMRPLPQRPSSRGYPRVALWVGRRKVRFVHSLVCEAFHGPRPTASHEVAHWDGDVTNAKPSNLRWATKVENEADKVRHGSTRKGKPGKPQKLTSEQVREIRAIWPTLPRSLGGVKIKKGATMHIQEKYCISRPYLCELMRGESWGHLK